MTLNSWQCGIKKVYHIYENLTDIFPNLIPFGHTYGKRMFYILDKFVKNFSFNLKQNTHIYCKKFYIIEV